MKPILVTGPSGLVGGELVRMAPGGAVTLVPVSSGGGSAAERLTSLSRAVAAELDRGEVQALIHCGGMTDVDACERDPEGAQIANGELPRALAAQCARAGAFLVHVSTDYVFDGRAGPYGEDDRVAPLSAYGRSKLAGEEAVRASDARWAIARTAVVFGPRPTAKGNFGRWVAGRLDRGEQVTLFTDQNVTPTGVENLAEMLLEVAVRGLGGVFHLAGAETVTRLEFGARLCRLLGADSRLLVPVTLAEKGLAADRPRRSGLRTELAARTLEHRPMSLDDALARFASSWRSGGSPT